MLDTTAGSPNPEVSGPSLAPPGSQTAGLASEGTVEGSLRQEPHRKGAWWLSASLGGPGGWAA